MSVDRRLRIFFPPLRKSWNIFSANRECVLSTLKSVDVCIVLASILFNCCCFFLVERRTWIFNYPSNVLQKLLSLETSQGNQSSPLNLLHPQPTPHSDCIDVIQFNSFSFRRQATLAEKAKIINLIKRYNKNFKPRCFVCYTSSEFIHKQFQLKARAGWWETCALWFAISQAGIKIFWQNREVFTCN